MGVLRELHSVYMCAHIYRIRVYIHFYIYRPEKHGFHADENHLTHTRTLHDFLLKRACDL